ncbi:MAG TPA: hypothetical protein DEP51_00175 [Clostridiales bacterium]|nr:hypothetical protein [Clostridiales bacterium]
MTKAIKEIIIMLLICLIAMLGLAIALYKYIPSKKNVPEIAKYEVSEQVQDLLEDNIDKRSDQDRVILTYEVTKGELSGYQTTNDYIPGKSNPFGEVSKTIVEDDGTTVENNDSENNNSQNNEESKEPKVNPSNPSIYEDKSTK